MATKKKATKKKTSKKKTTRKKAPPRPAQLELEYDVDPDPHPGEEYVCEDILRIGANSGEIMQVAEFNTIMALNAQDVVLMTCARIDVNVRQGMTLNEALGEVLEVSEAGLLKHYTPKAKA